VQTRSKQNPKKDGLAKSGDDPKRLPEKPDPFSFREHPRGLEPNQEWGDRMRWRGGKRRLSRNRIHRDCMVAHGARCSSRSALRFLMHHAIQMVHHAFLDFLDAAQRVLKLVPSHRGFVVEFRGE